MRIRSLPASLSLSFLLAATAAAQNSAAVTSPAPTSLTRDFTFPVVGVAGTETLQVNVINLATLPPNVVATASCAGTISFANASGAAIGTPVKFSVGPGQIFSAPLPFSKTGYSSRGEILAGVQQTVTVPSSNFCTLAISMEVFDTTSGVLHATLSTPAPGAAPIVALAGFLAEPPSH